MSRRPPTPKHDLYAHILELHTTGIDRYDRVTYSELQAYHRHQHLQEQPNHHHIGRGLNPSEQPQGWNDGGCRYTAVDHKIDQVPHSIPDSRGNRVRIEGCDFCACGCKYWENDRCIDCGSTEPVSGTEVY